MANARALCLMENAAKTVFDVLVSKVKGINLAQQWIFPEIEHWDVPSIVLQHGVIGDEEWVDKNLNVEQRVSCFLSHLACLCQSPSTNRRLNLFRFSEQCLLLLFTNHRFHT